MIDVAAVQLQLVGVVTVEVQWFASVGRILQLIVVAVVRWFVDAITFGLTLLDVLGVVGGDCFSVNDLFEMNEFAAWMKPAIVAKSFRKRKQHEVLLRSQLYS